ncbi:MAG: hypothetical protein GC192_15945 [Bacteroidetes bacterium]|nr:hypothetical protein [Bacteroidota bacterium]
MLQLKINAQSLFLAVAMVFFVLPACNKSKPNSTETSAAHQQAIELTETMQLSHKGMIERLDFLKTENEKFKHDVKADKNPADSLRSIVMLQDSLINQFETMCREQQRLIDENEDLVKKHERQTLDAGEVAEQHRIIRENYDQLQMQAAAIVQEVENIKIRIDGADLEEK